MVAKNLLDDVLALPASERLEMAERIWESLRDDPAAYQLSAEQKALLDARLLDMELHPDDELPWEQVEAKLKELRGK